MSNITEFFEWFFDNLPGFLMSEPIKYFIGFYFLGIVFVLLRQLIGGNRG